MILFKYYTYSWWQIGIFKLALLVIGAIIGAYFHEFILEKRELLVALAIITSAYIIYISLRQ